MAASSALVASAPAEFGASPLAEAKREHFCHLIRYNIKRLFLCSSLDHWTLLRSHGLRTRLLRQMDVTRVRLLHENLCPVSRQRS